MKKNSDAEVILFLQAVILNLRISTRDTRLLGVENHIIELQLILKQLIDLQVQEPYICTYCASG